MGTSTATSKQVNFVRLSSSLFNKLLNGNWVSIDHDLVYADLK